MIDDLNLIVFISFLLSFQVLGILAVVCTFGGSEGVTQTVMGLHHLARARNEKPFAVLVDALQSDNPLMPTAVLALVNAIMNVNVDLCDRISYRNDLRAVQFNEVGFASIVSLIS